MKAHIISTANSKSISKFFVIFIFLFSLLSQTSCSKLPADDPASSPPVFELDKNIFFTFRAGTDSFTSYGVKIEDASLQPYLPSVQGIQVSTEKDSTGSDFVVLKFDILNIIYGVYTSFGNPADTYLGNCSGSIYIYKKGATEFGKYQSLNGDGWNSTLFEYKTISNRSVSYNIVEKDFSCEITAEGALPSGKKYLEGIFTCKAYNDSDSSVLVPLSGSFRLNRY